MLVSELDGLCDEILKVKGEIEDLQDLIEEKKANIKGIQDRVFQYFIETNREEPYVSPYGTLYIREDSSVNQPRGTDLKALFEHFVKISGEDVAWNKLTINNRALLSEIKHHIEAVENRGGDPILEPLPGVGPLKKVKTLQFRRPSK